MKLKENKKNQDVKNYLNKGYIIKDINKIQSLEYIRKIFIKEIVKIFPDQKNQNAEYILNNIHKKIKNKNLNEFRLKIFNNINNNEKFKISYYNLSKEFLDQIVGNELAMQSRINLSIQMPKDSSSLLPIHADTWSGVSPFEVVVWLPLVNCYKTKTMYFLKKKNVSKINRILLNKNLTTDQIFQKIKKNVEWLELKYGQVLIFDQSIPHGNVVNNEIETRWSMNCRFKGIFTPYGDKKLGEFFEPISLKPASLRGINYKHPF